MSEDAFRICFTTASDQSDALTRILRKQRSLPERGLIALFAVLGWVVGLLFMLLISIGVGIILIGILGAPIEYVSNILGPEFDLTVRFIIFCPTITIVLIFIFRWIRRVVRFDMLIEDQSVDVILEIDSRGVIEIEKNSSSIYTWAAIPKILYDENNIFIFIDQRRAFVIPRAAFDEPADADRLIGLAQRSISQRVDSPPFRSEWLTLD